MKKSHAIATATAAGVVGVIGAVTIAPGAQASIRTVDTTPGYVYQDTHAFTSPSSSSSFIKELKRGDALEAVCMTAGTKYFGTTTWYRVKVWDGTTGYVSGGAYSPQANVAGCPA
jgi:hypothetical protein